MRSASARAAAEAPVIDREAAPAWCGLNLQSRQKLAKREADNSV
jgi:hypothetical protein